MTVLINSSLLPPSGLKIFIQIGVNAEQKTRKTLDSAKEFGWKLRE
jgi:hypothetical protein